MPARTDLSTHKPRTQPLPYMPVNPAKIMLAEGVAEIWSDTPKFLAAYERGAVALGLEPGLARRLIRTTFVGSLALADATGEPPARLRDQVTSPNGTTRAGLDVLQGAHLDDLVAQALEAARDRARELSR